MPFTEQIERIRRNVEVAGGRDPKCEVFGAQYHRYRFNPPATAAEVRDFESRFNVRLPVDYAAFVTTIGNGGPGHFGGAGPYYGIYRLGVFGYMQIDAESMSSPCVITSSLSESRWKELTAFDDESESPEHDAKYKSLFSGLMTIGTQGCNYQTMLALNGADAGRVVFIDQDLQMPSIAPQKNFLDWYERWLDKLVKGA